MGELGQVMNVDVLASGERVIEGDVDAAVAVLDIENNGVSAHFPPVLDDPYPVVTAGHNAGQVDSPDLEVLGNGDRLLDDRSGQDARNDDLFASSQVVPGAIAVRLADGLSQFAGSKVGCPL